MRVNSRKGQKDVPNNEEFWDKKEPGRKIWYLYGGKDQIIFSFDRVHKFYLFRDYPHKLTREQKEIFDKEEPYWADFFKDRTEEWEKSQKE